MKGNIEKALKTLDCRIRQDSSDLRSKQLMSDILWWENEESSSEEVAKKLYAQPESASLPGLRTQLARRIHHTRVSASVEGVAKEGRSAANLSGEISHRYAGKSYLGAGVDVIQRLFKANPTALNDTRIRLSHVGPIARYSYLEASAAFSPSPDFLPQWSFGAQPHYVFSDGSDVSTGLRFHSYPTRQAYEIAPEWTQPVSRRWTLDARASAEFASSLLLSGAFSADYTISPDVSLHGTLSAGRTLESATLESNFWSGEVSGALSISPRVLFRLTGAIYRGDLRDEDRIGGGLDWLF